MSLSECAAVELSPADSYPSPPTSPQSAKRTAAVAPGKNITKATLDAAVDSVASATAPASQKEYARPVTPAASTASGDEDPQAAEEALKLSTWKIALSLADMRCGATRKDNKSCENKISAKKADRINDVVKLLWVPSNTSMEVETHLDSLAKLAHCHYHDHPPAREARISKWLVALPGQPRPPSLQKRLRNILGSAPTKCTSLKKDGKNCGNAVGREKRFYCDKTITKMIRMAMAPQDEDDPLMLLTKVMQHYMLCHVHRAPPYKQQDEWTRRISKFRAACQNEMNARNKESKSSKRPTEKEEIKRNNTNSSKLASPPPTPRIQRVDDDPGTYWDTGYETSRFDVLGKCDMVDESKSTFDEIRDITQELLNTDTERSENEVNDGFVYLYQVPGNEHLVKIGFTTGSVAARLEKWKKDCHREPAAVYPTAMTCTAAVPHAHRVERLVHAELMEHRVRLYCERCGKQHVEWFEVPAEDAVRVIEKWCGWMRTRPYVKRETREGVKWYLKEAEAKRLSDVAKFLKELQSDIEERKDL
ncbi:DNA-binding protein [Akanthomyces lecanii RCEF 1005]|uniref:DNA-binding protein n=1 Tax=Akanthomyces lecanii RCEF 1005 TaxID=1081108 RepID=A0A168JG47_CORDF|nr:DNA-binding protein [Akanthomyces lecanii RCEF 1005]